MWRKYPGPKDVVRAKNDAEANSLVAIPHAEVFARSFFHSQDSGYASMCWTPRLDKTGFIPGQVAVGLIAKLS